MISIKRLKENLIGDQEAIDRMLRVLPVWIQLEHDNPVPASPRIIKDLEKRLAMVREIANGSA